jgi:hypothetical protein
MKVVVVVDPSVRLADGRPADYHTMSGTCINCSHMFERDEYDQCLTHYCTYRSGTRPPCGSVLMEESFLGGTEARYDLLSGDWERWSRGREVESHGTCSRFEAR